MIMALLPSVRITSEICSLTATVDDKDNPSSDALLSDNLSNSKETGGKFVSDVSTLHARAWSPNLTLKILILSETHVMY